jgi:hypothetical protein
MAESDLPVLYDRLKAILEPYAGRTYVSMDAPGMYGLDLAPEPERKPATWFAGVRLGKRYVSYYLMPVYIDPSMLDDASPELRKRMQGKSCFNLTRVDEPLIAELAALTARGYEVTAGDATWAVPVRETRSAERTAAKRSKAAAKG